MNNQNKNHLFNRREFVASASAITIIGSQHAWGASANEKIKLGLIGSGNRGTWISRLFLDHGGYEITACADYFEDRVNQYGDRFDIPNNKRFFGLSGYKRLLETDVQAVAIESPPFFHPEQAEAAVDAGKHVYVAKPIAVDVPGCLTIQESGRNATQKNLCFLVDFQTRANLLYIEALKRVHNGALGVFAFGESSYHAGNPWQRQVEIMRADPTNKENRIRAWGLDRILSGDIITEQNIHTLDVTSWILDQEPLHASGTCGRKIRQDGGTCHDSFMLVFEYPRKVGISFSSRQFEGYQSRGGIRNRMFGSEGVLETAYGGEVIIRGENAYPGGQTGNIFTDGAATNIADFHQHILEENFENTTVEPSVRSNLLTVLGRTAAYRNEIITWKRLLQEKEKLDFDLQGLKS